MRSMIKRGEFWIDVLLIALLGGFGIVFRTILWQNRMRMPPGDTFNFISGAQALMSGTYPPAEKRPPFFSFLIMLVDFVVQDPLRTAYLIVVASGVAGLILMYFVGRRFGIYRPVMAGFLFLALFDPTLSLYGVRPFSQGLFFALLALVVFLGVYVRDARWYPPAMAASLLAMALTRQEGILVAALIWLLLFFKLPWRKVVLIALLGCVFVLPWLVVVTRSTGSPFKLPGSTGYIEEFATGERGTTDPVAVWRGVVDISRGTWDAAWRSPVLEPPEIGEEEEEKEFSSDVIAMFGIGLFAVVGAAWMTVKRPKDMAIFAAAFVPIVVIAAWYRASGKYASPFISTWYVCAAAGVTGAGEILRRFLPKAGPWIRVAAAAGTLFIVGAVATPLALKATGTVTSELGMNWARVQAIRFVARTEQVVLFPERGLMEREYVGVKDNNGYPPYRGVYLDSVSEASVEEQREYAVQSGVELIIDDGSDISQAFIAYLESREEVTLDRYFVSYLEGDEAGQLIRLYRWHAGRQE